LSADFDKEKTAEQVSNNVMRNARPGSIIVFHDSEKAFPRLEISLRESVEFFIKKGFRFETFATIT